MTEDCEYGADTMRGRLYHATGSNPCAAMAFKTLKKTVTMGIQTPSAAYMETANALSATLSADDEQGRPMSVATPFKIQTMKAVMTAIQSLKTADTVKSNAPHAHRSANGDPESQLDAVTTESMKPMVKIVTTVIR